MEGKVGPQVNTRVQGRVADYGGPPTLGREGYGVGHTPLDKDSEFVSETKGKERVNISIIAFLV